MGSSGGADGRAGPDGASYFQSVLSGGENPVQEEVMQNYADGQVAGASAENVWTITEREAAERLVAMWNKDKSRRHLLCRLPCRC